MPIFPESQKEIKLQNVIEIEQILKSSLLDLVFDNYVDQEKRILNKFIDS